MQRNIVIAIVLVLIVAVAGWWYMKNQKSSNPAETVSQGMTDLFAQNGSVMCTYSDDEGRETTTYVKNGAVRSDFTGKTDEESGSMIMKDKTIYNWHGNKGYMMKIPDISVTPVETTEQTDENAANEEQVKAQIEKYKESCKNAAIADSLFTPPAEVTFTDYSKMMEQSTQMMKANQGVSEEQIKEYMQKAGQ